MDSIYLMSGHSERKCIAFAAGEALFEAKTTHRIPAQVLLIKNLSARRVWRLRCWLDGLACVMLIVTGMETTVNSTQTTATTGAPAPTPSPLPTKLVTNLDPPTVFATIGNPLRWQILLLLADGRQMSTTHVTNAFRRRLAANGKQLRLMSDAGVLVAHAGADRRECVYSIPKAFRAEPGVLDFGVCRIPLPTE